MLGMSVITVHMQSNDVFEVLRIFKFEKFAVLNNVQSFIKQ